MESERIKILAIDDIQDNLTSLRALMLESFPDVNFLSATSGTAGLDIAAHEKPDVILLDIVMPGMDGYEVCRRIKADPEMKDIPVVFVTALKGDRESRIRALDAGAEAFLSKPIEEPELKAQIQAMIKIRKAHLEKRNEKSRLAEKVKEATLKIEEELRERKQIEQALRESEARFRGLFENQIEAFALHEIILDTEGNPSDYRYLEVNQSFLKMTGLKRKSEIIGKTVLEIWPETDPVWIETYGKVALEMIPVTFENYSTPLDKYFLVSSYSSTRGYFATSFVDVTDRVRSEQALRDSEEKFRNYVESAPDAVLVADDQGVYLEANASAETITGYTKSEIIGSSIFDHLHPDDLPKAKEHFENVKSQGLAYTEVRAIHKDGTHMYWAVKAVKLSGQRFLAFISDITESKRALNALMDRELMLRTISENLKGFFYQMQVFSDHHVNLNFVSSGITRFGFTVSEVLERGDLFFSRIHPEDLHRFMEQRQDERLVSSDWHERFRYFHPDGRQLWVEVHDTPLQGDKGDFLYNGYVFDITDRKQAEDNLMDLESRYEKLFTHSLTGTGIAMPEGKIVECNEAFADMLGYTVDEMKTLSAVNFYSNPAERTLLRAVLDQGQSVINHETQLLTKSGETIYVLLNISPITLAGQNYYQTTCLNITDRKMAEEKLREREERFRLLVKNSSDIIVLINEQGIQEYVSPAATRITGFEVEELQSKHISEVIHPEDYPQVELIWNQMPHLSSQSVSIQYRHIHKSKGWVFLEALGQNFLHEPAVKAVVCSVRDITTAKQEEQVKQIQYNIARSILTAGSLETLLKIVQAELSKLLDTSGFRVAMYNPDTDTMRHILFSDEQEEVSDWPAARSLSGYVAKTGQKLLLKRNEIRQFHESHHLDYLDTHSVCWVGVPIGLGDEPAGTMYIQHDKDPDAYSFADLALLELVAHETGIYIERKRILEDLIRAKETAEESDRLKTAFINNISHEIRTPLNGILGFGKFLVEPGLSTEEREEYYNLSLASSNRLMQTVTDFVDISLITTGSMEVHFDEVDIGKVMSTLYETILPLSKAKKLSLEYHTPQQSDNLLIITDSELLTKALFHLLSNAVKFTDAGGVEYGYREKPGEIEFFISDSGKGIEIQKQKLIFEPFRQGDVIMTRGYEGSGLGLAIVKGIVDLLGGTIQLDSHPDMGSVFTINLPSRVRKSAQQEDNRTGEKMIKSIKPVILIAEDDDDNFLYLDVLLKKSLEHVQVIRVVNGEEAVEICRKNPEISLVLMDIKMPVLNGMEATMEIKTYRPGLPIIAVTAHAQTGDEYRIREAGCDEYVSKPVDKTLLTRMISKYLGDLFNLNSP